LTIVPYFPDHAIAISYRIQRGQCETAVTPAKAQVFAQGLCARTCLNDEGMPVCVAGVLPIWEGRGLAWALLAWDAGPYMREITRATVEALDLCPCHRIELYAKPDFPEANRWARMLGFEYEALLEGANPQGGDMNLYKRIKGKVNGLRPRRHGRILGG
jgi:hypothetical protein